jgi:uncharacterized membrane-anchored protein
MKEKLIRLLQAQKAIIEKEKNQAKYEIMM